MASSKAELEELHKLVATSFKTRLEQDLEDNIPTDAATLGAAIKFLKDNAVTADPADADDLRDLRSKFTEMAARRRQRGESTLALVQQDIEEDDLKVMQG